MSCWLLANVVVLVVAVDEGDVFARCEDVGLEVADTGNELAVPVRRAVH